MLISYTTLSGKLHKLMTIFNQECDEFAIKENINKSDKINSTKSPERKTIIKLDGIPLEQVSKIKYFGVSMTK